MTISRCLWRCQPGNVQARTESSSVSPAVLSWHKWSCWVGIAGWALWKGGRSSPGLSGITVLLRLSVVVSFQRVRERSIQRQGGAGYAIAFRRPCAEVGHLTSFRAEGTPGVALPGAGLATEGAGHVGHYTMLNLKIYQGVNAGGSNAWRRLPAIVAGGDDRSPRGRGIRPRIPRSHSNGPRRTRL